MPICSVVSAKVLLGIGEEGFLRSDFQRSGLLGTRGSTKHVLEISLCGGFYIKPHASGGSLKDAS